MFTPSAQEEVKLSIRSSRYIILSCRLKMPQLTDREQDQIDTHVRCEHKPVPAIITKINVARLKNGIETVDKSTVYPYVNGETHRRQNDENRGRNKSLTKADEKHAMAGWHLLSKDRPAAGQRPAAGSPGRPASRRPGRHLS